MALGKLDGVLDTNIGKAGSVTSTNIGKVGGGGFSDPYDSYTKLLLHMDGSNGSTAFTDSATNKSFTRSGNPVISTAQGKFNQSGSFDGSSYIYTADSSDFTFGSGDFTIDFWLYLNSIGVNGTYGFVAQVDNSQAWPGMLNNCGFYIAIGSTGAINFWIGKGSSSDGFNTGSNHISTGAWNHLAFVRNGSSLVCYINGVNSGSFNCGTTSYSDCSGPFIIGGNSYSSQPSNEYLNGYVDELRVSKGIARWLSNFTPPTSAYVPGNSGGTITYSGGYTIHTFTSSETFTINTNKSVDVLVVAGGAGSGSQVGGGGGGGGVIINPGYSVSTGSYGVTVGNGGTSTTYGNNGQDSIFGTLTAKGGGKGGGTGGKGQNGGSGGGEGWVGCGFTGAGSGTTNQGNNGGTGPLGGSYPCPGGGGAGAVGGSPPNTTTCGNGGNGVTCNYSGTSTYYGGGGAGAFANGGGTEGTGGLGGGGNSRQAGSPNTGGGAGGFGSGDGGSGIVIIRYLT